MLIEYSRWLKIEEEVVEVDARLSTCRRLVLGAAHVHELSPNRVGFDSASSLHYDLYLVSNITFTREGDGRGLTEVGKVGNPSRGSNRTRRNG